VKSFYNYKQQFEYMATEQTEKLVTVTAKAAEKIQELVDQGSSFGDVVILFEAMTASYIYEQALKSKGVPYFVVSGRGFYQQPEIRDMICFLQFLENPLLDIPLASILRSPMFQISDDSLFWLAHRAKYLDGADIGIKAKAPLYNGVLAFESCERLADREKEKIRMFHECVNDILKKKSQLRIAELLQLILDRTSYQTTCLAGSQGAGRGRGRLRLLLMAPCKASSSMAERTGLVILSLISPPYRTKIERARKTRCA